MAIILEEMLMNINYLIYKSHAILMVIGLILSIFCMVRFFRYYKYRREFAIFIKIVIMLVSTSILVDGIGVDGLTKLYDRIFYELSGIIVLGLFALLFVEKVSFYRRNIIRCSIERDFIEYMISLEYFLMFISINYGVENFIFAVLWQIVFISFRFCINKKEIKVKKEFKLYPSRQDQLKTIEKIIKESEYKNFAIAISGKWGSGKSLLLEALMARAEEQTNYYIYIRPMITDTRETLINEFQQLLSNIMIKNGIYCGRNSPFQNYFKGVLELLNVGNKFSILTLLRGKEERKSYRDFKNEVQKDIDALLFNKNKLVIVIDDFDRIDEEKQLDILTFITEVIDFDGCVVLFALDYSNITNSQLVTADYLEKFIATKIHLVKVQFSELIDCHKKEELVIKDIKSDYVKDILSNLYDNLVVYLKELNDYFYVEINKNYESYFTNDEYMRKLEEFEIQLRDYIDNSVRVIHFLKEIKTSLLTIDDIYDKDESIREYFEPSKAARIVYGMNFIKVFEKKIYNEIIEEQGIEAFLCSDEKNQSMDAVYVRILLNRIMTSKNFGNVINQDAFSKNSISFIAKFMRLYIAKIYML